MARGDHYSIADIACWPWVNTHEKHRIDLASYPAVNNWFERIRTRPATERAMQKNPADLTLYEAGCPRASHV